MFAYDHFAVGLEVPHYSIPVFRIPQPRDYDEEVQALKDYISLSTIMLRQQLQILKIGEAVMRQPAYAIMDASVTECIDSESTTISRAIRRLPLGSTGLRLCVTHPVENQIANVQGIGFSTESESYLAMVDEGRQKWEIVDAEQLSLRKVIAGYRAW
jgi:hypothetical protein